MNATNPSKASLPALWAMVVGSMVGAGIYSLPRNFALATGPAGAIVSWCIAGGGMYLLARIIQYLAEIRPDLDSGIFAYARDGFGDYAGFISAFGYWMAGCFGNVSYWVLIKSTLGTFIPVFGDGNTLTAIAVSSVGIWCFHWMLLRGVQQATLINAILTVIKVLPIFAFIGILVFKIDPDVFATNWQGGSATLGSQVSATMLVTVFVFLGIEGASVYSRHARSRKHVGIATLAGFAFVLLLLVLVTLLPFGVLAQADIALMRQPSMAAVLGAVAGPAGAAFISAALILSVLGAYLAWSLICAEVVYATALAGGLPRAFARLNAKQLPANAIWLTSAVVQAFVISTYWSTDAFSLMLRMTSTMALIPYLLVALFGLKVVAGQSSDADAQSGRTTRYGIAIGATIYTAFLLYTCGIDLLLMAALLYAPGSLLYAWARRLHGQPLFSRREWCAFAVVMAGAGVAILTMTGVMLR
ncbi:MULTISPECIES: basic amino acid/polyamine antiporter [Pandoraea]|uniref:basic amino acid/polyamine antiporter n=1 Tax=Pandoraea TaxID=93217 RepID=UPI001F5C0E52|nr:MULTISPECIES: basic amino acid/polyamine antiporter [Pandoraea]MCI3204890.1 arginine-ornithine antiporter [Pandoraea sp. LA3]MDN4582918.1 arginine-ornithine antiporter [Pandoraea capi]